MKSSGADTGGPSQMLHPGAQLLTALLLVRGKEGVKQGARSGHVAC